MAMEEVFGCAGDLRVFVVLGLDYIVVLEVCF